MGILVLGGGVGRREQLISSTVARLRPNGSAAAEFTIASRTRVAFHVGFKERMAAAIPVTSGKNRRGKDLSTN